MVPILFLQHNTDFSTNGVGRLTDAVECIVTEERNGVYELEMVYPITGARYSDIDVGMIIGARHDDTGDVQPFRIYKITRPISGLVRIYARHISYDLNKIVVTPFSAGSLAEALDGITSHVVQNCPFTFTTDKIVNSPLSVDVPTSVRSILGGMDGSILDLYGGEYEFDGYNVILHLTRGVDSDVTIRYGKNLTDLTAEADGEGSVSAVVAYWRGADADGNETVIYMPYAIAADVGTEGAYVNENGEEYGNEDGEIYEGVLNPMLTTPLDLSEKFEEPPTQAELEAAAEEWLNQNATLSPAESLSVSFVALGQTNEYAEYAPLQQLNLCDTVTVIYPQLGVSATMEVVKVEYNVLLERYDRMEVGKRRSTLAQTIADTAANLDSLKTTTPTITWMDAAIEAVRNVGTLQSEDGGLTVSLTDAEVKSKGTETVSAQVGIQTVLHTVEVETELARGALTEYADGQPAAGFGISATGMDTDHADAADAWQSTSYANGDVRAYGRPVQAYVGDTEEKAVTYRPHGRMTPDVIRLGMADNIQPAGTAPVTGEEAPDRNVLQLAGGWNTPDDAVTYEEYITGDTFHPAPVIHRGVFAYAPGDTITAARAYLHGVLIGTEIHALIPLARPIAKEVTAAAVDMSTELTLYQGAVLVNTQTLTATGCTVAASLTDIGIDLTLSKTGGWGGTNNADCTVCLNGLSITLS